MTYQSIADALTQAFAWFDNFMFRFFDFIGDYPLVSASILVVVGIPLLISVLRLFINISVSSEEMTFRSKDSIQNVLTKTDKVVYKVRRAILNKKRKEAIEAQRAARGATYSKRDKYVNAYMNSLK